MSMGIKDIIAVDEHGILIPGRAAGLAGHKKELAEITNPRKVTGGLADAVKGADVFIGTSVPPLPDRRDGSEHEPRCHRFRLCQSHAGNFPGRSKGGRCSGGQHGPQRLSQSGEQRSGLSWSVPRCAGCTGFPRDRGHEDRCRARHCRHDPRKRTEHGEHPAPCL